MSSQKYAVLFNICYAIIFILLLILIGNRLFFWRFGPTLLIGGGEGETTISISNNCCAKTCYNLVSQPYSVQVKGGPPFLCSSIAYTALCCKHINNFKCIWLSILRYSFSKNSNHDTSKVSATKLGSLSTKLPFIPRTNYTQLHQLGGLRERWKLLQRKL